MSNQTTPRKVSETVVDQLYDDCYKFKQSKDREGFVSYTVLYNPVTCSYFGLVYDEKEDQHYKITSEEQYRNGQHQNYESAFPFWLNFKESREKSTKQ